MWIVTIEMRKKWCKGRDLNSRTTKDKALNLASLAMLDYPCSNPTYMGSVNKVCRRFHRILLLFAEYQRINTVLFMERTSGEGEQLTVGLVPAEEVPSSIGQDGSEYG